MGVLKFSLGQYCEVIGGQSILGIVTANACEWKVHVTTSFNSGHTNNTRMP